MVFKELTPKSLCLIDTSQFPSSESEKFSNQIMIPSFLEEKAQELIRYYELLRRNYSTEHVISKTLEKATDWNGKKRSHPISESSHGNLAIADMRKSFCLDLVNRGIQVLGIKLMQLIDESKLIRMPDEWGGVDPLNPSDEINEDSSILLFCESCEFNAPVILNELLWLAAQEN